MFYGWMCLLPFQNRPYNLEPSLITITNTDLGWICTSYFLSHPITDEERGARTPFASKRQCISALKRSKASKSLLPTQLGKLARTAIDDHGLIPAKCIFWFLAGYSGYKLESIGTGRSMLKIFSQVLAGEPSSLQNSADDRRI